MTSHLCLDSKICLGFLNVIYRFVFKFLFFFLHNTYWQILNLEAFSLEKDKVAGNAVVLAGYICV